MIGKISQGAGDIIAMIPYMKELQVDLLYIVYNKPIVPERHPINNGGAFALIPFMEKQGVHAIAISYLDQCMISYDIDLDFRDYSFLFGAAHDIYTWNSMLYGVYPDMTKPFLYVDPVKETNAIIITQTMRSINKSIDYTILDDYPNDKVFLGTEDEYLYMLDKHQSMSNPFSKQHKIKNLEFIKTADYYEAAKILKSSRLYISNQTALAVIAEGISHNRILCVDVHFPCVIPKTPNGRPVLTQRFFQQSVDDMITQGMH